MKSLTHKVESLLNALISIEGTPIIVVPNEPIKVQWQQHLANTALAGVQVVSVASFCAHLSSFEHSIVVIDEVYPEQEKHLQRVLSNQPCVVGLVQVEDLSKNKSVKGAKGGLCNRSCCLAPNAYWFNHSTRLYYCRSCASYINKANHEESMSIFGHELCTVDATDTWITTRI